MPADFGNLDHLQVGDTSSSTYDLFELEGYKGRTPKLFLKPAGEVNKPYWREILKRAAINAKRMRGGGDKDGRQAGEALAANREHDRELFPLHVVTGWEDMVDGKRALVPYTRSEAVDFFKRLPNWLLDRIRDHAASPVNFVGEAAPAPADVEDVAGN